MSQEYISFPAIVIELKKLCVERVTGTLFIATKANRSVQIMIDDGEIVYIYFYNKRGLEAVELMSTIVAGKCRFQSSSGAMRKDPELRTQKVLQFFENGNNSIDSRSQGAAQKTASGSGSISAQQKQLLEQHLTKFIGPMAAVICEECLGSAPDLASAIDLLCSEIPSAAKAEEFKEIVTKEFQ